ncbi:hypothetical protein ANCCAN_05391 [Ancylostoma caninum]|uniref:Uncharacterized protein n=1 Tax=Ancylostoma caninum TaxID=29170 RepID=A0A368GW17_ANCCA|nr:hypothetical protein ANCCAN_05391 [Ancylostoma caninum]
MPDDVSPMYVPFTLSIMKYKDQLANHHSQCLQLDKEYRYDTELFHEYQRDLRYLLGFSEEVLRTGEKHLNDFYLFSDDQNFARAIMVALQINENWQPHVHVANFSRIMDLYVSQHICGAVLLTSSRSTHGWWLGFLAPPQAKVHFMRLDGEEEGGVQMFL